MTCCGDAAFEATQRGVLKHALVAASGGGVGAAVAAVAVAAAVASPRAG
jgi:hypothetical protein